ncbi:MAG: glycerophosphodiester phosphodiesterase [Eubacteriales bacterium]|nr:glycerophosphodiester phosphodiesterase [Eubacteriales bacterium]
MPKTLICAHAGAENTQPNTLESLALLFSCGADLAEVDLRADAHGGLILCHDRPKKDEEHPTFTEALRLLKQTPNARLNLDVKEPGVIFPAWEAAQKRGLEGRIIFTGDVSQEEADEAQKAGLPLWINQYRLPVSQWRRAHLTARERGFAMLNIDWRGLNEEMLEDDPARLSVWTVDEEEKLRELLALGVGSITTREPALALRLRREIQGE